MARKPELVRSLEEFTNLFVAPDDDRWVDRMLAGLHAAESMLLVSISLSHSGTKFHPTTRPIGDRSRFFKRRLSTKGRWFSLTSGGRWSNDLERVRNIDVHTFGGDMTYGGELFGAHLRTPELPKDLCEKLLVAVGDAMEIESGQYSPASLSWHLRNVHWCTQFDEKVLMNTTECTAAEARLPIVREGVFATPRRRPHHFGWLNYWSAEVCAAHDYPRRAQGSEMLKHSYRTPRGAWLIKLTAQAPTTGDDEYVERLREAYERFPEVANRLDPERVPPRNIIPSFSEDRGR